MKKLICLLLLTFSISSAAQRITTDRARAISDSLMKIQLGDRLFSHFSLTTGYYTYTHRNGYELTGSFLEKKKIPKNFKSLHFLYHFTYPDVKGVGGGLWVIIDENLKLRDSLNFDFIPDFVIDDKPSNYIGVDEALKIASANFKEKGLEITQPELSYNSKRKLYTYKVFNKTTKTINAMGKDAGEMEVIEINSLTGSVEELLKGYYGVIIR